MGSLQSDLNAASEADAFADRCRRLSAAYRARGDESLAAVYDRAAIRYTRIGASIAARVEQRLSGDA